MITDAFYDAVPQRSLFQGCSTGGRMAMRAALDGPEMFDGIIAGAPAMDYPGLVGTKMAYLIQSNTRPDGTKLLDQEATTLIETAVLEQCDAADGSEDGAVADPNACMPDYSTLICKNGASEGCLSAAQMEALTAWREGPRAADGTQLYPGGVPGGRFRGVLAALANRYRWRACIHGRVDG